MIKNKINLMELETKILLASLKKTHYIYNKAIDRIHNSISKLSNDNEENNLINLLEQTDSVKRDVSERKICININNFNNDQIIKLKKNIDSTYTVVLEFCEKINKFDKQTTNIYSNHKEKLKLLLQEIIDLINKLKHDTDKINGINNEHKQNIKDVKTEKVQPNKSYYSRMTGWLSSYWK